VRPAVFLDRDGTIIHDVGYLRRLDQIDVFPWSIDAIRCLNRAGLPVVVTTNQAGIARGLLTESFLADAHRELSARLQRGGARIDAYYYCPHHPEATLTDYAVACDCRKPRCGMIDRAARELGLDPARSFVVGDGWRDVGMARAAGARSVLVGTGPAADEERTKKPADLDADAIVDNLAAAVSWILTTMSAAI
jgi:D-glycero-D-manno-heptose 1,7-bisphosphate phosphatase